MGGRWPRWRAVAPSAVVLALLTGLFVAPMAAAAPRGGTIYVVNALAGSTVKVTVDGAVVRSSAAPGSVVGPLTVTRGQHVLQLSSGGSVVVGARFGVATSDTLDVVAHRAADQGATPVVTVFRNDLAPVGPGKTRLVVSHVATAEPADIRIDAEPYFRNVANGESLSVVVPAGRYSLDLVPTVGPGRTILAPVRVSLAAGTLTRVFAYGNPEQNTTDAIVQVLRVPVVGARAPSSVHTGDGGQAADALVSSPAPVAGLTIAGLVGVLLAGLAGARRGAARGDRLLGSRPQR